MINELRLDNIRLNPHPPPIRGGREFSRNYKEAFLKIEDILSHYALGNIDYEYAIKALLYAKNAIIPKMNYSKEIRKKLINLYDEALKLLQRLRTPEKIKQWLLNNGPPRLTSKSLENYMRKRSR